MKKFIYLVFILFVINNYTKSQSEFFKLTAGVNAVPMDTIHLCIGDTLKLHSWKDDYLMNNNFNNSSLGVGWTTNITPLWSNPCPPTNAPAGGVALWFGGSTFPRELKTVSYDISCYDICYVEFDMKYGANQNMVNCESPDIGGAGLITDGGEGVHLLYSNNGGLTWTQFTGIDNAPSGTYGTPSYISGSGGYWTPVAFNAAIGPYYQWNHYKCQIPAAGISTTTKIRWFQNVASGNSYDHWGIDNVQISCPTAPVLKWYIVGLDDPISFSFVPPPIVMNQDGVFKYYVAMEDNLYNNHCNEKDTVVVIVHNPKDHIVVPDTVGICMGDSAVLVATSTPNSNIVFRWTTLPPTNNDTLIVHSTISGFYEIRASDTTFGAHDVCFSFDTVHLVVEQPPIIQLLNDTVCIGDTAILFANAPGQNSYLWNYNSITDDTLKVAPAITSLYKVIVSSTFGCKDSATASIIVNPRPTINISNNTEICMGKSTTLTATGGNRFLWRPDGQTTSSIVVSPTQPTNTYTAIVFDANNCSDSSTVDVSVIPYPIVSISTEQDTICKGNMTTITAEGGTYYDWSNGDNTPVIYVKPSRTTEYKVSIGNNMNNLICSKDTNITINVIDCNFLYVPNSFSPQGLNQVFRPVGEMTTPTNYTFEIFNRWGALVFSTNDVNKGWDGKIDGEYATPGVYIYKLNIKFEYELPIQKNGTVTIIR